MKKLLLLLAILPLMFSCNGQENKVAVPINRNINNTPITLGTGIINVAVFTNVIEIAKSNVTTNGSDYIFDISIPTAVKAPVLYISAEVPSKLLPTIYPEFQKITIITPNWALVNDTSYSALEKRKPSFVIYKFDRTKGSIVKDSLVIFKFPEMKFAEKYKLKNNEVEIYYSEYYGSICCPTDPQYSNTPTREDFIKFFEKENSTKIADTYKEKIGDEGESSYHYTLNKMTNPLRLKFIRDRNFHRILNRKNKDIIDIPKIYTPFILEINNKIEKI